MSTLPEDRFYRGVMSNLAFALINGRDEIILRSNRVSAYLALQVRSGKPDLLQAVDGSLRSSLSAALARSRYLGCVSLSRCTPLGSTKQHGDVLITIRPFEVDGFETGTRIILFDDVGPAEDDALSIEATNQTVISDLYAELMRSRDGFHRLTLDHEKAINRVATLNEELYSINEELRAASNELIENRESLEADNTMLGEMVDRVSKANDDLENFVEATELALVSVDLTMRIVRITDPARTVFRLLPSDIGRSLLDISHCLQYQTLEQDIRNVLRNREKVEREVQSRHRTWYSLRIVPYTDEAGNLKGAVVVLLDISLRKEAEENLRIGERRWKAALVAAGDGIWDWDVATNKSALSPAWRKILGYETDEFVAGTLEEWEALIHPEDHGHLAECMRACANDEPGWFSHEYRIKCKNGHWKWVLSRGAVVERHADGKAKRLIGTLSDISTRKNAEYEIWYRANYDHLTGLPNRSFFLDRLGYEVLHSKRLAQPFAVLFIDLDRFKEVNDLHGHSAGDFLLRLVADALKISVRESDTVARLGGDEFTVILAAIRDAAQVELVAEEILRRLAEPMNIGGNLVHISASIGITCFPKDADSVNDLIRNADQAMYVAKNAGRNCCRFFSQQMQDEALARISITNDLHAASNGQLQLLFQPILDLRTGTIVKAEALLRWRHPTRGLLKPDHFIHLAEEAGLINRIGDWVFNEAATAARRLSHLCSGQFQVSINKSPLELSSRKDLPKVDWISRLGKIGLDPGNLIIEITEGALLHATHETMETIGLLRKAVIQFALDDFGTGYSSMSYLANYNVDYLKIDKSFVTGCRENAASSAISEAMVLLAHRLGLKVVAEGVELREQHDWLRAVGCDYSQGFLYSHPVEIDALEKLIRQGSLQKDLEPSNASSVGA